MATFTWIPEYGAAGESKPRVNKAVFGDGYEQRVRDGINTIIRTWDLTFMKTPTDMDYIETFLNTQAGSSSFEWTPPTGNIGKWLCDSWKRASNPGYDTLTCTFREVFGE